MTDITELAQRLKAAADREMICRDVAETSEIWERTVTPENILALVEALASEKRICATWRKTAEANSEKLEKAQQVDEELCKLLPPGAEYMDPPDGGDVEPIEQVRRMVADYRQRIAELESRTVTVKLPEPHAHLIWIQAGHAPDDHWDDVAVSHSEKDRCCDGSERYPVYARWEIEEMLAAAGIKVEAE